ncbi:MAG: DUF2442 domain-containing protein [Phycisphaeraceae bacterium]
MSPRVVQARYLGGHRLALTFDNGLRAEVDFRARLLHRHGMFEPLHDPAYFARVRIDAELGTLVWPNGVDICPDVLFSLASGEPIPFGEQVA